MIDAALKKQRTLKERHASLSQIDMLSSEGSVLREKINKLDGILRALSTVSLKDLQTYINSLWVWKRKTKKQIKRAFIMHKKQ